MNDPLVSILIPCYNAEAWLAQTLESALAQTWPHKEIIVVNDGSTDSSLRIAKSYDKYGVRVIDQPNKGQSAAFNTAIAAARGDYYEFLDADDLLHPEKIAHQVALARTCEPGTIISGSWTRFTTDPHVADFSPDALWQDCLFPVEWLVTAWSQDLMMHGAAWLIPASLIRSQGGWNEDLSLINDFEFFSRIILAAPCVRFCPEAKSYYRSELPNSLSGQESPKAMTSAFHSLMRGTSRLLSVEDSPRTRAACIRVFQNYYFGTYPAMPDLRVKVLARIHELGGELGRPDGGPAFQWISRIFGWRIAKRLKNFSYRQGYKKLVRHMHHS